MRLLFVGVALALVAGSALAQGSHQVRGYYRSDGTYVQPHRQTNPDSSRYNNYSTDGNINPYTGQVGQQPAFQTYSPPPAYRPYTPPAQQYYPDDRRSGYDRSRSDERTRSGYGGF